MPESRSGPRPRGFADRLSSRFRRLFHNLALFPVALPVLSVVVASVALIAKTSSAR
jgi:hypothetical protein